MLRRMNDDFPILAAIAANPTHPYALLEHLQSAGLPVTRSTIYRRVESLVANGWLEADDVRGENGHYRRALALSKLGRARVEAESREVLASEALESPLFSLAVAALGDRADDQLAVLRPRLALAARRLTEEERALRDAPDAEWSRTARERRIAHLQADITWLQGLMGRRVVVSGSGEATRKAG